MVPGRITRGRHTDNPGGVGVTPSGLISNPPPSIPILRPDALPTATLPIYPGLGQAQEYAGLHNPMA